MRYALALLAFACIGCGNETLPIPPFSTNPRIASTVELAKQTARNIASKKCIYAGYMNLGIDDYGALRFQCDNEPFTLELGQSHIFDHEFFGREVGDEVTFRYSEELLMKPIYREEDKPQATNPAYYLEPLP